MDINVDCPNPNCRKSFPARAELEGTEVPCPACGKLTEVPWSFSPDDDPMPEALRVEDETEALPVGPSETTHCPSCNGRMPAVAVVCVACGYHRKTGKRLATVRERKAEAVIRPVGAIAIGVSCCIVGCNLMLLASLCMVEQLWFVALLLFLLAAPLLPVGAIVAATAVSTVRVFRQRDGRVCCTIVHELMRVVVFRKRFTLTKEDRLVLCHDFSALALVTLMALLCIGVIPGVVLWILLLSKRTNLEIRKAATGRVERFSLLWGESGTRELIDTIREVEHLTIERA